MLSVLMATHNGSDTILRTLAAMAELEAPKGGWKLIIVNNASTDDTEALILRWKDRLPLDYMVEPKLGKSIAMNAALARAGGDLIVMTDDDVLPDKDWLVEWRRMADEYPDLSVFGGKIDPAFEVPPPSWLGPEWCFTVLYAKTRETVEGEVEPYNLSGPNLAMRASVRDEGWRFGEDFLVGKMGLMGEDAEFVLRMAKAGHKIGFAPKARVRHIIHREQLTLRWIQRRFFRHGRTMFLLHELKYDNSSDPPRFAFPRWHIRHAAEAALQLAGAVLVFDTKAMFRHLTAISYDLGALDQAMKLRREHKGSLASHAPTNQIA